jgi:hypothetical protein
MFLISLLTFLYSFIPIRQVVARSLYRLQMIFFLGNVIRMKEEENEKLFTIEDCLGSVPCIIVCTSRL